MKNNLVIKMVITSLSVLLLGGCFKAKVETKNSRVSEERTLNLIGNCFDDIKGNIETNGLDSNGDDEDNSAYERAVINYQYDQTPQYWEKGIFTVGYTAASVLGFIEGKPSAIGSGINSLLAAFSLWGLNGHTGDPTIQDVLVKLNTMDKKIDDLSSQLNSFAQKVQTDLSYITYGIQQQRYDDFKRDWDNFVKDYINKMDDIMRNFQTKYREEFTRLLIDDTKQYYPLRIYWVLEDGELKTAIANPNNPYKTISGTDIKRAHLVSIPMSYFAPLREEYEKHHYYTEELEEILKNCISQYLDDHLNEKTKVNMDQIYASIVNEITLNISDKDSAREFNNLFINFANHISGEAGSSALDAYFTMMECFYNFQSEAEAKFQSFRAKLKESLSSYYSFASILRVYSLSDIAIGDGLTALINASARIFERTNVRELGEGVEYSYVLGKGFVNKFINFRWIAYYDTKDVWKCDLYVTGANGGGWCKGILNTIINKTSWDVMRYRYLSICSYNSDTPASFIEYLQKYANLPENAEKIYSDARKNAMGKGTTLPDCKVPVICSFDGEDYGLGSEDFVCRCYTGYMGHYEYFLEGVNYHYKAVGEKGDGKEQCWSGGEARGTVIDLNSNGVVATVLDRWARYDERHPLWINDELYSFNLYGEGLYCYAFYTV